MRKTKDNTKAPYVIFLSVLVGLGLLALLEHGISVTEHGPTPITAATPYMFKVCDERCVKLDKRLDRIIILETYGTYSAGRGSHCSLSVECKCRPVNNQDSSSDSTVIPAEHFSGSHNPNVGVFGAHDVCKEMMR